MNLIITTKCDQSCEYCFIPKGKFQNMELGQIEYIANFHDFNRIKIINILGGEPTLHPEMAKIITILRASNMNNLIQIFSHCGNDSAMLEKVKYDNIVLVANCYENRQNPMVEANLRLAKKRGWTVVLSYTIYKKEIEVENIIEFCKEMGIKIVRWSLAMPAYKRSNSSIPLMDYREYISLVEVFNKSLLAKKIASYNDCPIPICMNRHQGNEYQESMYVNGIRYGDCNPPYDIYPDYKLTGCMGIGDRIQMDLRKVKNVAEIEEFYKKSVNQLREIRSPPLGCSSCQKCKGGCFGFFGEKT